MVGASRWISQATCPRALFKNSRQPHLPGRGRLGSFRPPAGRGSRASVGGERRERRPRGPLYGPLPSPSPRPVPLWFFLSAVGRGRCAQARADAAAGPEGARRWPPRPRRSCRRRLWCLGARRRGFPARLASRRAEWRVSGGRGRAAPPQAPEASGVSARRLLQRGVGRGPRP